MRSEKSCARWRPPIDGFALPVFLTTTTFLSTPHAEAKARIETAVPPRCEVTARDLGQRLETALGDAGARELDVSVVIEHHGAGYRVELVTSDEYSASREKVMLAPTCDEAVDAAVVVLALATSETAEEEASLPSASTTPSVLPAPAVAPNPAPLPSSVSGGRKDESVAPVESSPSRGDSSRASFSAGIDLGTLPSPTLVVSGGFARSLSALEVRALARYGLPTVNETTETNFSETLRRDFGALEVRACYGAGADVRLSACAGGELGAVRVNRRVEGNGSDVDEDAVSPRLSGVLAAFVRHQGGAVQPELEVSGSALAVGREESASWLSLRVSAGAAVEF